MKNNIIKIANIAALVLIVISVFLTFMPQWHYVGTDTVTNEEGKKVKVEVEKDVSIQGYIWMIDNHKELTKIFDKVAKPVYEEEYQLEKAAIEQIADKEVRSQELKDLKKRTTLDTNELIGTVVLMMVICVAMLIFVLRNFESLPAAFLSIAFGIITAIGFLSNDLGGVIFRMGNTWNNCIFHVVIGAVVSVLGVVSLILNLPLLVKKLKGSY